MIGQVDHPVLLTEGACNPLSSRNRMAELLFETYGVPSVGTIFFDLVSARLLCNLARTQSLLLSASAY